MQIHSLPLSWTVLNVGIGLSIFSVEFSRFANLSLLWVYISYIALNLVIALILLMAKIAKWRTKEYPKAQFTVKMQTKGDGKVEIIKSTRKTVEKKRKEPAADSKHRWMLFGFFAAINLSFMFIFIVLIAL